MSDKIDITQYKGVIFDFDGPLCNAFASLDQAALIERCRRLLDAEGWVGEQPPASEPFELLRAATAAGGRLGRVVEAEMASTELRVVPDAPAAPGTLKLLRTLAEQGRRLAIASNNSRPAIHSWLERSGLSGVFDHIAARTPSNFDQLKPCSALVVQAVLAIGLEAEECLFVGDSLSDAEASRYAGTAFVGLANKPDKPTAFQSLGCNFVRDMAELL